MFAPNLNFWRPTYLLIWDRKPEIDGALKKKSRDSSALKSLAPHPTQNPVFAPEYVMYMFLILRNIDNDYLIVSNSIKLLYIYIYVHMLEIISYSRVHA